MDEFNAAMALPEVIAARAVKDRAWREYQYEKQQAETRLALLLACFKSEERAYLNALPWNK